MLFTSTSTTTMQSASRRAGFLPKNFPSGCLTRRLPLKRTYGTKSGSSQQVPRGQDTTLLFASTVLLSATSGYLLATYGSRKSGSTKGTAEVDASSRYNTQYGSAKDFREAIEELRATFPEPGAVSDDPEVLEPYGFSGNDYHPGNPCFVLGAYSY